MKEDQHAVHGARIQQLETTIEELSYLCLKQQAVMKNLEHRLNAMKPEKRIRTVVWK